MKSEKFKDLLLQEAGILSVTSSKLSFPRPHNGGNIEVKFKAPDIVGEEALDWERMHVDDNFLQTFGIELLAGRDFKEFGISDSSTFIINHTAVKTLGLTSEEAIGATIYDMQSQKTGSIIGVIKDFHFKSFHYDIDPLVLTSGLGFPHNLYVKVTSENIESMIVMLEENWHLVFPEAIFIASFYEDHYNNLYESEYKIGKIFK